MDPLTLIALAALGAAGALDVVSAANHKHVVCAWCKRVIQQGNDTRPEHTSHGMCTSCEAEMSVKIDAIEPTD